MVYQFLVLLLVFLFTASPVFAKTEERVTKQTFSLNHNGTLELTNVHGDITIRGWDKDAVDMKATKRGPEEKLDLVRIEIDSQPEKLTIHTKYPRERDTKVSVTYELMVPKGISLNSIENVNGGISVTGVKGEIKIDTVNGSAEIDEIHSGLDAETVNGNISANWIDLPQGARVTMSTVNGGLELELPSGTNAEVHASSTNGSIETDFPLTIQGKFISRKINGRIGEGGANIDLSTVNGSIDIVKAAN